MWHDGERLVKFNLDAQLTTYRGMAVQVFLGECAIGGVKVVVAAWEFVVCLKFSWKLLSLYDAFGFRGQRSTSTAGRWVVDGFDTWARFATDVLQLPSRHILKAKPYAAKGPATRDIEEDPNRVLPFPSISTTVLVGLALRWSWGPHRLRGAGRVGKVREFLRSCTLQFGPDWSLQLLADSQAELRKARPWHGTYPFELMVVGGAVQLANLKRMQPRDAGAMRTLCKIVNELDTDMVPIDEFLEYIAERFLPQPEDRWLAAQDIHGFPQLVPWGNLLSEGILVAVAPGGVAQALPEFVHAPGVFYSRTRGPRLWTHQRNRPKFVSRGPCSISGGRRLDHGHV